MPVVAIIKRPCTLFPALFCNPNLNFRFKILAKAGKQR
jgi:hypothetical protein